MFIKYILSDISIENLKIFELSINTYIKKCNCF